MKRSVSDCFNSTRRPGLVPRLCLEVVQARRDRLLPARTSQTPLHRRQRRVLPHGRLADGERERPFLQGHLRDPAHAGDPAQHPNHRDHQRPSSQRT